jgi:hypothetical protein
MRKADSMALTTDDVFQAAFDLSSEDRTQLVERLLDTLPDSDADETEKAWKERSSTSITIDQGRNSKTYSQ